MGTLVSASAPSMGRTTGGAQSQQGGEDGDSKYSTSLSYQMFIMILYVCDDHHQMTNKQIIRWGKAKKNRKGEWVMKSGTDYWWDYCSPSKTRTRYSGDDNKTMGSGLQ